METNFTQGEWLINVTDDYIKEHGKKGVCIVDEKGAIISFVSTANPKYAGNCDLIAAAPAMYNALKELSEEVSRQCNIGSDPRLLNLLKKHQKALQAIAKAEGKP